MLKPVRTVAPAADLFDLATIKAHCRIETDEDDTLLATYRDAATRHLDGWSGILGRCLVNQTWRIALADWPACGDIRLPFPDVSSVTVTYYDTDNAEQTVNAALYELLEDERGGIVRFLDAFTQPGVYGDRTDAVRVTLVAGYGAAASAVPAPIVVAAMMLTAHWYASREAAAAGAMQTVPLAVETLTTPYRHGRI